MRPAKVFQFCQLKRWTRVPPDDDRRHTSAVCIVAACRNHALVVLLRNGMEPNGLRWVPKSELFDPPDAPGWWTEVR